MSSDPSSIESDLQRLNPVTLDQRLLTRLDACASDTWTELDPADLKFEQLLRSNSPAMLPASLMDSLVAATCDVPFPGTDQIISFPQPATRHHRSWWSAAAVVALSGAITALLLPTSLNSNKLAASSPPKHGTAPAPGSHKLVPASFNRGLTEAHDEGVVWQSNDQPHRVLKVVYTDRATLKDQTGRTYQVEQPRVEYILVPAHTD